MSRKKKVVAAVRVGPVFNYTSQCCGVLAKKAPVERSASDRAENKFSECSLGSWRCPQCTKPCKVTRSRRAKVEKTEEIKETNG